MDVAGLESKITLEGVDDVTRGLRQVSSAMDDTGKKSGLFGRALGALGGGFTEVISEMAAGRILDIGKSFLMGAADMESYELQLQAATGSLERAGTVMQWITDYAAKTPFEMPELIKASTRLEAFGNDATNLIPILGDVAAATGTSVIQSSEAILDAQVGDFERLKQYGIKAIQEGGETYLSYIDKHGQQQKKLIDRNNADMVTSTITAIWNEKYEGAMQTMSQSFHGRYSTLMDNIRLTMIGAMMPVLSYASAGMGAINRWFELFGAFREKGLSPFRSAVVALGSVIASTFGRDAAVSFYKFADGLRKSGTLVGTVVKGLFEGGKLLTGVVKSLIWDSGFLSASFDIISKGAGAVSRSFSTLIGWGRTMSNLIANLGYMFQSTGGAVSGLPAPLLAISLALGALVEPVNDVMDAFQDLFSGDFDGFFRELSEAWDTARAQLSAVGPWIRAALEDAADSLAGFAALTIDTAIDFAGDLWDIINNYGGRLVDWIKGKVGWDGDLSLSQNLSGMIGGAWSFAGDVAEIIQGWGGSFWQWIKGKLGWTNLMGDGTGGPESGLNKNIDGVIGGVFTFIGDLGKVVYDKAGDLLAWVKETIGWAGGELDDINWSGAIDGAIDFLGDLDDLKDKGWSWLTDKVHSWLGGGGSAGSPATGLGASAPIDIGTIILNGVVDLAKGVKDKLKTFGSWIKGIVEGDEGTAQVDSITVTVNGIIIEDNGEAEEAADGWREKVVGFFKRDWRSEFGDAVTGMFGIGRGLGDAINRAITSTDWGSVASSAWEKAQVAAKIWLKLNAALSAARSWPLLVWGAIAALFAAGVAGFFEGLTGIDLSRVADSIWKKIKTVIDTVKSGPRDIWDAIASKIGSIVPTADDFSTFADGVASSLWSALVSAATGWDWTDLVPGWFKAIAGLIGVQIGDSAPSSDSGSDSGSGSGLYPGGGGGGTYDENLGTGGMSAFGTGGGFGGGFGQAIVDPREVLAVDEWGRSIDDITRTVDNAPNQIVRGRPPAEALFGWTPNTTNFQPVRSTVQALFGDIGKDTGEHFTQQQTVHRGGYEAIGSITSGGFKDITGTQTAAHSIMTTGTDSAWNAMTSAVRTFGGNMVSSTRSSSSAQAQTLQTEGRRGQGAMSAAMAAMDRDATSSAKSMRSRVSGEASNTSSALSVHGSRGGRDFRTGVSSGMSGAVSSTQSARSSIINTLAGMNLYGAGASVGSSFGAGVAAGAYGMLSAVASAGRSIANALVSAAQAALGIASPSRVAMQQIRWMAAGYEAGAVMYRSRLEAVGEQMGGWLTPNMASLPYGGGDRNVAYHTRDYGYDAARSSVEGGGNQTVVVVNALKSDELYRLIQGAEVGIVLGETLPSEIERASVRVR